MDPRKEKEILAEIDAARAAGGFAHAETEFGDEPLASDVYDGARYAAEVAAIFHRAWIPVAREAELASPGAHVARTVEQAPVVITRGDDGELRAFHNTCLHRGAAIVSTDGCAKRLTCRYHGWSYGLDGALANVPEPMSLPKAFDPSTKRLGPIRVATAWGWVFVSLDAGAPSLEASLGPELVDEFANFRVDALVHKGRVDCVGPFDWKVAVEGYLEDYHVPLVHPRSIHPLIQMKHTAMRAWDDHSRMVIALRAPHLYDAPNSAFAPPLPGLNRLQRTTTLVYLVWPSLIVNLLPNHVVTFQVLPVAKNETRVVLDVLGAPTASDVEAQFWEKLCAAYIDFVTEDFTAFTAVQRGLAGPFRPPLNLTHYDQRVRHFRRRVDAWLAR